MERGTHRSVLLREAVAALGCRPGGFWVDGTVGAGGDLRLDDDGNPGHRLVLGPPQGEQAVGVMRCYPIAQEARRRRDYPLAILDAVEPHRAQPGAVRRLADLLLEAAHDPCPSAAVGGTLDATAASCFQHHRPPLLNVPSPLLQ